MIDSQPVQYGKKDGDLSNVTELIEDTYSTKNQNSTIDETWKDIAQGLHTIADHYDNITDQEVAEVYNEFKFSENILFPPTQKVAEETAFKYGTEDIELEEAIELSKQEYK